MAKKHENMTAAQLEAELIKMNNEQAERRKEILAVHALHDQRVAEEKAAKLLENMSDTDRAALLQQVGAQGIPPEEN